MFNANGDVVLTESLSNCDSIFPSCTTTHVLNHFFWPSLTENVIQFCQSFNVCQCTGTPNQVLPPACLCPVPVIG